MTLWSAAEESVWPSRWPKTASTGTVTAQPLASWRWTSLNCWETVNMRWGKQVSNTGKKCQLIGVESKVFMCVLVPLGVSLKKKKTRRKKINVRRCWVQLAIAPAKRVPHFEIWSDLSLQFRPTVFFSRCLLHSPPKYTEISQSGLTILVKQKQTNY